MSQFQGTAVLTLNCYRTGKKKTLGYIEIVGRATELSMYAIVEEVPALSEYSTEGEVYRQIMCMRPLSICHNLFLHWPTSVGDY